MIIDVSVTREVDKNWVRYACAPTPTQKLFYSAHLVSSSILHMCCVSLRSEEFAENIKESLYLDVQQPAYIFFFDICYIFVSFSSYTHFFVIILCFIFVWHFVTFSCHFNVVFVTYTFLWQFCVSPFEAIFGAKCNIFVIFRKHEIVTYGRNCS